MLFGIKFIENGLIQIKFPKKTKNDGFQELKVVYPALSDLLSKDRPFFHFEYFESFISDLDRVSQK